MKSIWTILITVVATAAIVGGGTWYLIDSHANKDKDKLQTEIDTLNRKLADEANTSGTAVTSGATVTTGATVTDETASWKTYTSAKYGFSFKYPEGWTSTLKEETTEASQGSFAKDLVLKVTVSDPDMALKISCANNEFQNWKDASPSKATCDPILSKVTAVQKEKLVGPRSTENAYVRVYKKSATVSLNDWLYATFHKSNTELADYSVGSKISMAGENGYYSSIGCCAGVDRNYVIAKGDYVYSLGSNYFENTIADKNLPENFIKIASTFKLTTPDVTADWKKYTDSDHKLIFEYPADWIITSESAQITATTIASPDYNSVGPKGAKVQIVFRQDDTWESNLSMSNFGPGCSSITGDKRDTLIGGQHAWYIMGHNSPNSSGDMCDPASTSTASWGRSGIVTDASLGLTIDFQGENKDKLSIFEQFLLHIQFTK